MTRHGSGDWPPWTARAAERATQLTGPRSAALAAEEAVRLAVVDAEVAVVLPLERLRASQHRVDAVDVRPGLAGVHPHGEGLAVVHHQRAERGRIRLARLDVVRGVAPGRGDGEARGAARQRAVPIELVD